jgi:hypothetical protein
MVNTRVAPWRTSIRPGLTSVGVNPTGEVNETACQVSGPSPPEPASVPVTLTASGSSPVPPGLPPARASSSSWTSALGAVIGSASSIVIVSVAVAVSPSPSVTV